MLQQLVRGTSGYAFGSNSQLKTAVALWMSSQARASNEYGHVATWDVSAVTDMRGVFFQTAFNDDISAWDVSRVTKMGNLFRRTSDFDQSLNDWDVSRVTDMYAMFYEAEAFNQPLSNWDISSVTEMGPSTRTSAGACRRP